MAGAQGVSAFAPVLSVVGPAGGIGTAHDGGRHPERPARMDAVMDGVAPIARALGEQFELVAPEPAGHAALCRVHSADYLSRAEALCRAGGGHLDPDTYARPGSWEAALVAAGAGLQAVALLQERGTGVAFVATRPPGHHARPSAAMGFCLLNNVAVAAAALVEAGERVLIVDWDVHHGNGTQEIFWEDPSVLFVSTHQSPFYPGTGAATEVGAGAGRGLTVNVPLPAGSTGEALRRAIDEVAAPVVDSFAPTWVLVSAGFDAHRDDPLASLELAAGDFAALARTVAGFAPAPGRLVLFVEGGYDLAGLTASVQATFGALAGLPAGPDAEGMTEGGDASLAVRQASGLRRQALGQ
jgi:acetoin utilization deacetylase AcuC-like enzyme